MSLHAIPQKPSKKPSLQTFMVVAKKDSSIVMHQVSSSFTRSTIDCSGDQVEILVFQFFFSFLLNFCSRFDTPNLMNARVHKTWLLFLLDDTVWKSLMSGCV